MKALNISSLEQIQGGSWDSFCTGFQGVAIAYGVGVAANWWNPVGQSAALVGSGVLAACWLT